MTQITNEAWNELFKAGKRLENTSISQLFEADKNRFNDLSFELDDLLIDFSKENIDKQALKTLLALAEASNVECVRNAMFKGELINRTEQRAVLHTALRNIDEKLHSPENCPELHEVSAVLDKFLNFAEAIRNGDYTNNNGAKFTDVINLGIGGSDLGSSMAVKALKPDADGPNIHFVANIDGTQLHDTLAKLDPHKTLVIISSKTFTTSETMMNARSALAWLREALQENYGKHLAAVSTNIEATTKFGIDQNNVFGFWDWVGGRYSIWSAIGLPLAIAIGRNKFLQFHKGAADMDKHFCNTPLAKNLPVLMALVGIWRRNVMKCQTVAVVPYDQRLEFLPDFLQQLEMESNGKAITNDSEDAVYQTSPVIWGSTGSNSQHSFFQLLHQGTDIIPVDFIMAINPRDSLKGHHKKLLANCLAQGQSLAFGKSESSVKVELIKQGISEAKASELAPHKTFKGNRPSTTIIYDTMQPYQLGRLIALYEHKVFVQGVIWNINSFDQWGVELGKINAVTISGILEENKNIPEKFDSSTASLIQKVLENIGK